MNENTVHQSGQKTIVIDFDGTIVDHEFPGVGRPKPGVKEAIGALRDAGYKIIISSCRNRPSFEGWEKYVGEMTKALLENEIPFDSIDMGREGKPLGLYYIDDRAIEFRNNWEEIAQRILKTAI